MAAQVQKPLTAEASRCAIPTFPDSAPSLRAALWKAWLSRQPGKTARAHHIKRLLLEEIGTPEAKSALGLQRALIFCARRGAEAQRFLCQVRPPSS